MGVALQVLPSIAQNAAAAAEAQQPQRAQFTDRLTSNGAALATG